MINLLDDTFVSVSEKQAYNQNWDPNFDFKVNRRWFRQEIRSVEGVYAQRHGQLRVGLRSSKGKKRHGFSRIMPVF